VTLVEDVVVTGERALTAVGRLREEGADVMAVVCAVDCERGADDRLAREGIPYFPLFRYSAFTRAKEKA
jgi:orotate phosphoribosyltransferase